MSAGSVQVGYRVVTLLLDLGETITIVTQSGREEWMRRAQERGARLLIGDARDEELLEDAGLGAARAIIACTDDDSANVEIALDARRLRPEMRVIVRIFDPNLARQSETHLGFDRAIAMAAAAAPAFAAAIYGDRVLSEFVVGEDRFLALRIDGPRTLDHPPLVVFTPAGAKTEGLSPELAEGESAVSVVRASSVTEDEPTPGGRGSWAGVGRAFNPVALCRFAAGIWTNTSLQLRAVLVMILAVILISVAVFRFSMHLSTVDAFYYVVATVTTTGYGDISPVHASDWLKLYACLMMLLSAAGMAVLFSMVTDYLVTARLMQLVGRQRIPDHGHVIVVGIGSVGFRTVEELLRLGLQVVAVDGAEDGDYLSSLRARVPVIIGDARERDTLHRAGAEKARAVIATSPDDAVNLSVGLAAKEVSPNIRLVLRVFDADFAIKIQTVSQVDAALSASRLAAPAFVGAALHEHALASFRLGPHFCTICEDPAGPHTIGGRRMSLNIRGLQEVPMRGGR